MILCYFGRLNSMRIMEEALVNAVSLSVPNFGDTQEMAYSDVLEEELHPAQPEILPQSGPVAHIRD